MAAEEGRSLGLGSTLGCPSRLPLLPLSQVTESTHRALYDAVIEFHFSPTPDEVRQAAEDPDNFWVPRLRSRRGRADHHYALGRWFAVWRSLEEPEEAPRSCGGACFASAPIRTVPSGWRSSRSDPLQAAGEAWTGRLPIPGRGRAR